MEKKDSQDKKFRFSMQNPQSKYIYLVFAVAALIVGITFWPTKKAPSTTSVVNNGQTLTYTPKKGTTYEETLEKRLEEMLKDMEGVGEVSVMVTLSSNEEKILAENITSNKQHTEEKDKVGGSRVSDTDAKTNDILMQSGNVPYVIREEAPVVKGVFIVADGGDNDDTKLQIMNAVSSLLDVPVHKISVEKRK